MQMLLFREECGIGLAAIEKRDLVAGGNSERRNMPPDEVRAPEEKNAANRQ